MTDAHRPVDQQELRLWSVFLIGRSVATGVFLGLLVLLNGWPVSPILHPVLSVAATQFAINGVYLYLWRRRDITFLGYLTFAVEILLITLLIFTLGQDGHVFVLAYIWPIIVAALLIGPRAAPPLTLLSCVVYALLFIAGRRGFYPETRLLTGDGTSLARVLSLPYLAFLALLVWALVTEIERHQQRIQ